MKLTEVAAVHAYRRSMRDAAEVFARDFWGDNPRSVGQIKPADGMLRFKLVDGNKWYRVTLQSFTYIVQRED